MGSRVPIAEFGIIQKVLAGASVAVYESDDSGASTGVLATLYQAANGTPTRGNPQVLDENGQLEAACYVDTLVVGSISGITEATERSIRKIRVNPIDYPLHVTSAQIATAVIADSIDAAVAAAASAVAALASQVAAAASAATSSASIATCNADVVLTHADVVLTHADVVLTHADVVSTHADVISCDADVTAAALSASAAATSAAVASSTMIATSVTSNTIGTGALTWTTQANKQFQTGQFFVASNGINWVTGTITSYNAVTGDFVGNSTKSSGAGTFASWNISVSGAIGADGAGSGSVTSASVVTNAGVSASVANPTTTPAFTFTLGAITPTTVNGLTITSSTGTLTVAAAKVLTISNTLTFTGTDTSSVAFGTGGTVLYSGGNAGTPSAIVLTNATGTAASLTAGNATLAAGLSGTPALPNGTTATTQAARDGSTKLATNAYVDAAVTSLLQNSKSTAYTTILSDAGKQIYHPAADVTARIWTIDSNANVAYAVGTLITFTNDVGAGVITIAITADTLVLAGSGVTGSRTLAAGGTATAQKMTATRWMISGVGIT